MIRKQTSLSKTGSCLTATACCHCSPLPFPSHLWFDGGDSDSRENRYRSVEGQLDIGVGVGREHGLTLLKGWYQPGVCFGSSHYVNVLELNKIKHLPLVFPFCSPVWYGLVEQEGTVAW